MFFISNSSYAIFPLSMLKDEKYKNFSSKEFMLYTLLLNRLNLSKKNARHFCDEKGLFVYYSNSEIEKDVRCSHPTVTALLQNLENAGLIHKEYQKNGLPLKIYVNDIREKREQKATPKVQETSFDIERALSREQINRRTFGDKKNKRRTKSSTF